MGSHSPTQKRVSPCCGCVNRVEPMTGREGRDICSMNQDIGVCVCVCYKYIASGAVCASASWFKQKA